MLLNSAIFGKFYSKWPLSTEVAMHKDQGCPRAKF